MERLQPWNPRKGKAHGEGATLYRGQDRGWCFLEKLRPPLPLRLSPPGSLWEPGLYLKPHASPSDAGKRTVSVHTAHKRRHTPHTPQNTDLFPC